MDKPMMSTIDRADQKANSNGRAVGASSDAGATKRRSLVGSPEKLGKILASRGHLSNIQLEQALAYQQEHSVSFGIAAKHLGLVTEEDLNSALAAQFGFPYVSPVDTTYSRELVAAYEPEGEYSERLRRLRSDLIASFPDKSTSAVAIAVTSPSHGDGRTHLVANLAVVFSQLGKRVLVVDADLRESRIHDIFKLSNDCGVSVLLSGRECTSPVRKLAHFPGLRVLTSGPKPPNPQELVSNARMSAMLASASKSCDVVLIDTPPTTRFADAENMAQKADLALIVARRYKTPTQSVIELSRRLRKKDVSVAGCVLVS